MDMCVKEEDVIKVLKEVRELIKENILPRLTELEEHVRMLRRATWPVCQALREKVKYSDPMSFLEILSKEESTWLSREKIIFQ